MTSRKIAEVFAYFTLQNEETEAEKKKQESRQPKAGSRARRR